MSPVIETVGFAGGTIYLATNKIMAFQHHKSVGDMTSSGKAARPQTKVYMSKEGDSEEWIILESVDTFRTKYEASIGNT